MAEDAPFQHNQPNIRYTLECIITFYGIEPRTERCLNSVPSRCYFSHFSGAWWSNFGSLLLPFLGQFSSPLSPTHTNNFGDQT